MSVAWVAAFFWGAVALAAPPELRVAAYDSLAADGGWLKAIVPDFEKRCACAVRLLPSGDAGQLLARLKLDAERGKPVAQVAVGLDQNLWKEAGGVAEPWKSWKPRGWERIPPELRQGDGFLPIDRGYYALMADTRELKRLGLPVPRKLSDLLNPKWKRRILLEDPRVSTPGLAFLLYTSDVLGDGAPGFWKGLSGQWLTLAAGWDAAYGLFLKEEAPLVWSYLSSEAYHREKGDSEGRYRALALEEGAPLQIEGAIRVAGASSAEADANRAREFLEFLVSEGAQERLPKTQWMWPARRGVKLPKSFEGLALPARVHSRGRGPKDLQAVLREFERSIGGAR